jgi:hypothetical protein
MKRCNHEDLYIVRDYRERPLTELGWYLCGKCDASFVGVFPTYHTLPEGTYTGSNNVTVYEVKHER